MGGFLTWWKSTPLYIRIMIALVLGAIVGTAWGEGAANLEVPAKLILRVLGALAPPLILIAVIQALMKTEVRGALAAKLGGLLVLNTVVAIVIGLFVANVIKPGSHGKLELPAPKATLSSKEADPQKKLILETMEKSGWKAPEAKKEVWEQFLDNVPKSLAGPLVENNVIGIILLALAFGTTLRAMKDRAVTTVMQAVDIAMETLVSILHGIIQIVPIGIFGIVASIVGKQGFAPFAALGYFIVAVLIALFLQACYYLTRVRLGSWVRPGQLLQGCRDALVMAFSTASSTATMPVTFQCLWTKVGLRERSASMGSLVGSNFNNDGTALYEAMSALFVAQLLGQNLTLQQQLIIVLTSIVASVGAAGIPEAGLVTMTLVFTAVGLDVRYIALLFTVDWFLDRCRTMINVMGDMNISCLLDGKTREEPSERLPDIPLGNES